MTDPMRDEPDYDLLRPRDEVVPEAAPPRSVGVWIAAAVLLVGIAIAAYVVFGRRHAPATTTPPPPAATAPSSTRPLGGQAAPIALPPLDQTDSLVRDLVRKISSHPEVAAWLATNGLIRNFAVVVTNIADGATPAVHLQVLRPSASFQVTERGGDLYIDPRSYDRYDGLAAAIASVDPADAARLYSTLKLTGIWAFRTRRSIGRSNARSCCCSTRLWSMAPSWSRGREPSATRTPISGLNR